MAVLLTEITDGAGRRYQRYGTIAIYLLSHIMIKNPLIGVILSLPFAYCDAYIYREPVWFTLALFMSPLSILLFFIAIKMKNTLSKLWRISFVNISIFFVSVIVFSPTLGYIGNYVYPYRIERFARSIPVEIKQFKHLGQTKLPEEVKLFLLKNNRRFPMVLSEDGVLLSFRKYSLFKTDCQQAIFYLKDSRWEFCLPLYDEHVDEKQTTKHCCETGLKLFPENTFDVAFKPCAKNEEI
jgi:hypothetical protein